MDRLQSQFGSLGVDNANPHLQQQQGGLGGGSGPGLSLAAQAAALQAQASSKQSQSQNDLVQTSRIAQVEQAYKQQSDQLKVQILDVIDQMSQLQFKRAQIAVSRQFQSQSSQMKAMRALLQQSDERFHALHLDNRQLKNIIVQHEKRLTDVHSKLHNIHAVLKGTHDAITQQKVKGLDVITDHIQDCLAHITQSLPYFEPSQGSQQQTTPEQQQAQAQQLPPPNTVTVNSPQISGMPIQNQSPVPVLSTQQHDVAQTTQQTAGVAQAKTQPLQTQVPVVDLSQVIASAVQQNSPQQPQQAQSSPQQPQPAAQQTPQASPLVADDTAINHEPLSPTAALSISAPSFSPNRTAHVASAQTNQGPNAVLNSADPVRTPSPPVSSPQENQNTDPAKIAVAAQHQQQAAQQYVWPSEM